MVAHSPSSNGIAIRKGTCSAPVERSFFSAAEQRKQNDGIILYNKIMSEMLVWTLQCFPYFAASDAFSRAHKQRWQKSTTGNLIVECWLTFNIIFSCFNLVRYREQNFGMKIIEFCFFFASVPVDIWIVCKSISKFIVILNSINQKRRKNIAY